VLAGLTLSQAAAAIDAAGLLMDENPGYVFSEQDKDVVLTASVGDTDVSQGAEALFKGQQVELTVSAGRLPAIQGMSFEDAAAALAEVEVSVESAPQQDYNDEVPEGAVIGIVGDEPVHPGDTVLLNVSRGPTPVDVPDILGRKWVEARDALSAVGLKFEYWNATSRVLGESGIDEVTVERVSPDVGTSVPKGSVIRVKLG
jgi:serine/threonine-protein kinase